jgi:hypothetical protein
MSRLIALTLMAAGAAATAGTAQAERRIAAGLSGGTTGASAEATVKLGGHLQVRGGYNYLEYGIEVGYEDIDYSGDLDLSTLGAFVDLRPFGNAFILTGGAFIGDKALNLIADPSSTYEIGDQTFTSAQVGTLRLDAELEETAPFVGLGWDTTFQGDGAWGFKLIAGAMFTGSPSIDVYTVGGTRTPSEDALLQQEIAEEEANLQDDVDGFEVFPVVQLGLTLAF